MRIPLAAMLLVVLGLALPLGAQQTEEAPPSGEAAESDAPRAPEPQPEPKPLVVPKKERDRENPVAGSPEVIARGERLFASQCTMCHGATGDGKGDLVDRLGLKIPDYTEREAQESRTDGELFYILGKGHGSMPGQEERLTDDERWILVHHIRSLGP